MLSEIIIVGLSKGPDPATLIRVEILLDISS